jgi:hypothetical protein
MKKFLSIFMAIMAIAMLLLVVGCPSPKPKPVDPVIPTPDLTLTIDKDYNVGGNWGAADEGNFTIKFLFVPDASVDVFEAAPAGNDYGVLIYADNVTGNGVVTIANLSTTKPFTPVGADLATNTYKGIYVYVDANGDYKVDVVLAEIADLLRDDAAETDGILASTIATGYTLYVLGSCTYDVAAADDAHCIGSMWGTNVLKFGTVAAADTYDLTLTQGVGGTMTADATNDIEEGTTVTITVTPDSGKQVDTFTVNSVDQLTALKAAPVNQYSFDIAADTTAVVTYKDVVTSTSQLTLNVSTTDGKMDCDQTDDEATNGTDVVIDVIDETVVTITVTPDAGYRVLSFAVDTDASADVDSLSNGSAGGDYLLTMDYADVAVTVAFEVIPTYTITFQTDITSIAGTFDDSTQDIIIVGSLTGWAEPSATYDPKYFLSDAGSNIFEVVLTLEEGNYEYKFFSNYVAAWGWSAGEYNGGDNRSVTVDADKTVTTLWGDAP